MTAPVLTDSDRATLQPMTRPEKGEAILSGKVGPLGRAGLDSETRAMAYLFYLCWIRAKASGILSGKPGFKAIGTMADRVTHCARRAPSLTAFCSDLFSRLGLRLSDLSPDDYRWWLNTSPHVRWHYVNRPELLSEALIAARCLEDVLLEAKLVAPTDTVTEPGASE